jgi:acyl-CoA dehydrogenase
VGADGQGGVEKRAAGTDGKDEFLATKLLVGRFYMERIMPETALRKTRIETGADTMMELAEAAF